MVSPVIFQLVDWFGKKPIRLAGRDSDQVGFILSLSTYIYCIELLAS